LIEENDAAGHEETATMGLSDGVKEGGFFSLNVFKG
jgi:hypothetical protein